MLHYLRLKECLVEIPSIAYEIIMKYLITLAFFAIPNTALANNSLAHSITSFLDLVILPVTSFLAFLFLGANYSFFGHEIQITILGLPLIVAWLIFAGLFFTIKLKFVNIRLFKHGIDVVRGKYISNEGSDGKITPLQALFTAVSATVGLGNIAGVAIAISIGGPGAVIWMMIAAFFGMSTKFTEVSMGQKYRRTKDGHLLAGAFYYLEDGLKDHGKEKLGKFLAKLAAIFCIGGAIGAGIMFQANQSVSIIAESFNLGQSLKALIGLVLAGLIAFVLLGGIVRVAHISEKIVPLMALIYIVMCIAVLVVHNDKVLSAINLIFTSAFSQNAAYGGVIGAIVQGFKRAAFSNEAGLGSAPIAHAAAKVSHPMQEGSVSILEPFIDTITICFLSGIVIVTTGAYLDSSSDGILISQAAFNSVAPWFTYLLSLVVFLFAFSTMLTYSYYGKQAWTYLTKGKHLKICYTIFAVFVFIGSMLKIGTVIDLADILFLIMSVPNLIGLYIMSGTIKKELEDYIKKLK